MTKKAKSYGIPWEKIRMAYLKDADSQKIAIEVAVEEFEKDNNVEALLNTVRLVAKAQGGLAKLARKASISQRALREAFSSKGNPRLRTFQSIIDSIGYRISVEFAPVVGKRSNKAKLS